MKRIRAAAVFAALALPAAPSFADRTRGTMIGAAGGGLLGRTIDRGEIQCR